MDGFNNNRESISEYIELWEKFGITESSRPESTGSLPPLPPRKDSLYIPRAASPNQDDSPKNGSWMDIAPPALSQLQTSFRQEPALDIPTPVYPDCTRGNLTYVSIANTNQFRPPPQEPIGSPSSSYSTSPLEGPWPAPPPLPRTRTQPTSVNRYANSAHPPPTSALPPIPGLPAHPAISIVKPRGQTPRRPPTPPLQSSDFRFEQPRSRPATPQPPRGQQQNEFGFKNYQMSHSKVPGSSRSSTPSSLTPRISSDIPGITAKAAKMLGIDLPNSMVLQTRSLTPSHPSLMANSRVPSPSFPTPPHSRAGSSQGWNSNLSDLGYFPTPPRFYTASYDPSLDATSIWEALKRSKKPNTEILTKMIIDVSYTPAKLPILRQKYKELYVEDIKTTIKAGTSGPYRIALLRLIVGPWESEADWLNSCGKRDGKSDVSLLPMDDKIMAEAIFGKQPDEIEQIKTAFATSSPSMSLETVIEGLYLGSAQHPISSSCSAIVDTVSSPNLTFGGAVLQVLRAGREYETAKTVSLLSIDQLLTREAKLMGDVEDLYRAEKRLGGPGSINKYLDQDLLLELIMKKSDIYLRDLCTRFRERHVRELVDVITSRDRVLVGSAGVLPNNLVTSPPSRDPGARHL